MLSIASSFLTAALALVFLYVLVVEFRAVGFWRERDSRSGRRYAAIRLWLACGLVGLKLGSFIALGGVFHFVMACVWLLNASFAWLHLKQDERSLRLERTWSVTTANPDPPSPAIRLQEIKSEMAELDAEKRELEKHPDANRF